MINADTTRWVLAGTLAFLLAYNLAAYLIGGNDATISRVMQDFGREWPVALILIGLVLGHWFWWQKG